MAAMWAAAIGAAAKAATAPPLAPGMLASDAVGSVDNSGWTVATGRGNATASRTQETAGEGTEITKMIPWLIAGVVGIVAFKAWGKK